MWAYAQAHGADFIATGHYAQNNGIYISKGVDTGKDQSYFLWMIAGKELPRILFPIGHLQKNEVRKIAQKAKLFTAEKKDSQGICFLGDVDMTEFLSHYIEQKVGNVVDTHGTIIGKHNGVYFYTLGERHGFTIDQKMGTHHKPYYVVEKNIEENILIVSHEQKIHKRNSGKVKILLREQNNFDNHLEKNKTYTTQIRYHGELIPTKYDGEHFILTYPGSIALGQSLVVFDGEKLVAGGIIEKTV
jgi:tRNA-specific 2-thiouridylase